MELEKIKDYVVERYLSLKITYNDGMDSVPEYGKFRAKCAEANTLYSLAQEFGFEELLVDPPDLEEEWSFWSGVEGVQFHEETEHSEYEDDEMIKELGDLPEEMEAEEHDYEDH